MPPDLAGWNNRQPQVYQRDRMGRVKTEMVNGRVLTHAYGPLGRRTRRITPTGATTTYTHDLAGNRTQLTTSGHTLDFTHEPIGREITRHLGDTQPSPTFGIPPAASPHKPCSALMPARCNAVATPTAPTAT